VFRGRGRADVAPSESTYLGPAGRTPQIPVSGKGSGRVSIAGLVCVRPGHRPRLIYRVRTHRGRKGERRSFAETDYAALLDAAHQQLGAPIVVIWDNLNTHISHAMRTLIAARDWLTVIRLPPYAPELNPTEHVWSHVKRSLGNLIVHGIDQLTAIVKNRLKRIQYRPDLIDAFFAHTGLNLEPQPP
jgi:transposase